MGASPPFTNPTRFQTRGSAGFNLHHPTLAASLILNMISFSVCESSDDVASSYTIM